MSAQQHQRAGTCRGTRAESEGEEQVLQADETASKNEDEETKIVDGGGE